MSFQQLTFRVRVLFTFEDPGEIQEDPIWQEVKQNLSPRQLGRLTAAPWESKSIDHKARDWTCGSSHFVPSVPWWFALENDTKYGPSMPFWAGRKMLIHDPFRAQSGHFLDLTGLQSWFGMCPRHLPWEGIRGSVSPLEFWEWFHVNQTVSKQRGVPTNRHLSLSGKNNTHPATFPSNPTHIPSYSHPSIQSISTSNCQEFSSNQLPISNNCHLPIF